MAHEDLDKVDLSTGSAGAIRQRRPRHGCRVAKMAVSIYLLRV